MTENIENINQVIWELKRKIDENRRDPVLKRELLRYFHESRIYTERKEGVPEEGRSFLLLREKESTCCMLMHGAGGTPEEMKLLGEHLHEQGCTVYGMRLPIDPRAADSGIGDYLKGRLPGANGKDKEPSSPNGENTWSMCLAQAEVVLDMLLSYTPDTFVVGFSFGGTIALNLLRKFPARGGILISPGLFPVNNGRHMAFRMWRKFLPALTRELAPVRSTMIDFVDMTRCNLDKITQPILVIQAKNDPVTSYKCLQTLKKHGTNPASKFVLFPDGGHVLINGKRGGEVMDLCGKFVKEV